MQDPLWSQILIQIVLIFINAYFACSEIALLSLNETKLRRAAEEGDKRAEKLSKMIENPTNFLSTIQVGITLAGFLASAFAADSFAERLAAFAADTLGVSADAVHSVSVIVITLVLSFFMLVFGEIVPKRIAMKKPEEVAKTTSGVLRAISVIFRPIVWLVTKSVNGVLRLFGMNPKDEEEKVTEEEIMMMVDAGEESGNIESGEKELIENIFEFKDGIASEVMTHRRDMKVIDIDDSDEEIMKKIIDSGVSRFPVCGEGIDDIVGILVTKRYLLNRHEAKPLPLEKLITEAYRVPETIKTDTLFREMQRRRIHLAIVCDEYGGTAGLVTLEDLLEEIVGDIYDEYDKTPALSEPVSLGDGKWRASGNTDIDTLCEMFDLDPEAEEFSEIDTLGGIVFSALPEIPEDGSRPEIDACGLHIKVDRVADRRIVSAVVSKNEPAAALTE